MRISANLGFLYADLPMVERIAAAARDGFDAVEFHWPYDTDPDALRAALDTAGLSGLGLNTRRGDAEGGEFGLGAMPGREAEARAHIEEAIAYAATAGIGAVHVMAGKADGAEADKVFTENLAHACALAGQAGLTVLIEPINWRDVPGYFLAGTGQARRIVEQVNRSELRIMYDFYHMQIMQGDHVRCIEELGDLIGHMQIASVPDRAEPDNGELDFAWIFQRTTWRGYVGAEYHPRQPPGEWLSRFRQPR